MFSVKKILKRKKTMNKQGFFGYGSLISPSVVGSYFADNVAEKVDRKFKELDGTESEEEMLQEEFVQEWRDSDVKMIPVKVYGFERRYNLKSDRGGLMLSARQKQDSWINGVVITDLPEEQKEIIRQVEQDYREVEISHDDLEVYEECDLELPDTVTIFVEQPDVEKFDEDVSDYEINQVYQKTILAGIDLLGELYGDEFAERFRNDYLETTIYDGKPLFTHSQ